MINEAANILKENSKFLITTHLSPDGDGIGSMIALANAIRRTGKNSKIYIKDKIPQEFSFLLDSHKIVHELPDEHFDAVYAVDCANIDRIGAEFAGFSKYDVLVNIDHHRANNNFGDVNVVDRDACSAGFLVFKVLTAAEIEIDCEIAKAIYTTILLDTGSFRYSNVSAEAFEVAAEMIDKGVNAWDIAEKVYENQPINRINLLKLALGQMEVFIEKGFASMTISKDMLRKSNAVFDITDGFINFPRSINGIEVALLFKELDDNTYKLSLRSKGNADVNVIAERYGGGGHKNAAGCILNGNIDELKADIFGYLESYLKGSG